MDDFDGELEDEKTLIEKVGYGSPPKPSRWKPGQSGNPLGRPRNRKTRRAMLAEIAFREVSYKNGGRDRKTNIISAILLIVKNKAIAQHAGAAKLTDQLLGCYMAPDDDQPVPRLGVLFVDEPLTAEEWEATYTPERVAELSKEVSSAERNLTETGDDKERTRDSDSVC